MIHHPRWSDPYTGALFLDMGDVDSNDDDDDVRS
jgi:hypothetical protein